MTGSGAWCFAAHESAREDRIEIYGSKVDYPSLFILMHQSTSVPVRVKEILRSLILHMFNSLLLSLLLRICRVMERVIVRVLVPLQPTG